MPPPSPTVCFTFLHTPYVSVDAQEMKQLLIFCLLFGSIFHHGDAGCIMRGLCQKHTENAYGPCVTNDTNVEPTAFDKTHPAYEKMVEFCPHLLTGKFLTLLF